MNETTNPIQSKLIRWGGVALVIFAVGLSGFVPMIVVKIGAVVFGSGLALWGKRLLSTDSEYGEG